MGKICHAPQSSTKLRLLYRLELTAFLISRMDMLTRWLYLLAVSVLSLLSMVCNGQVRDVVMDLGAPDAARPIRVAIWYPEGVCSPETSGAVP